ncbi:hypothetical protein [Vineibacter terrae]|uniref:hypothetical protein n=1 Tax=Vineibacter terrae TaxID=2586908 RepID=UPI002E364625|nr:hypothetical protein [Vineibacter terrae]HEX2892299.1 hypothetical protein [Vineibacter terrae]
MAASGAPAILSLQGVAFADPRAAPSCRIDLELGRGDAAIVEVDATDTAASLIDLCLGLVDPPAGAARFLDHDWRGLSPGERFAARSRIGSVVQSQVWPTHLSIAESIMAPRLYHRDRTPDQAITEATALARTFGLPGVPAGQRDATAAGELVRAACVRAFLGAPALVVVQDAALDAMAALGVAMAQAVAAVQDRGGAVLWIIGPEGAPAARFVQPGQALRLGDRGLAPMRRSP